MLRIAQEEEEENTNNRYSKTFQRSEAKLLCFVILFLISVCVFCVIIFIEQKSEREEKEALKGTLESIGVEAFDKQMEEDQKNFDEHNTVENMNVEKIKNLMSTNFLKDNNNQIKDDGYKAMSNLNDAIGTVEGKGEEEHKEIEEQIGNYKESKVNNDMDKMNDGKEGAIGEEEIKSIESDGQLRQEINKEDTEAYGINVEEEDKSQVKEEGYSNIGELEREPNVKGEQHLVGSLAIEGEENQADFEGDKFSQDTPFESNVKEGMDKSDVSGGLGNN